MAVGIDRVREAFIGDGVSTVFNTTLLVSAATQIRVFDLDESAAPTVTRTELLVGIGFTAVLNTPTSLPSTLSIDVSLTHSGGLPVDHTLIVIRDTDIIQDQTVTPGSRWPDSVIELMLDKTILHAQMAAWKAERAITIPVEDDEGVYDLELPRADERASKVLFFDGGGNVTAVSLLDLSSSAVVISALSALLLPSTTASAWRLLLSAMGKYGLIQTVGVDLEASRPAAATFGTGVFFSTDSKRAFYSTGAVWSELIIGQFDNASMPAASIAGRILLDTDQRQFFRDTGAALQLLRALPPMHLQGCAIGYVTGTTMSVAAGWARDVADTLNMRLASSMTKTMNTGGSWVAGAGNNAAPSGALFAANTWYGVFVIAKPDGTTDWGIDTSLTAANLLAAASGYTLYRRVGWIRSDGTPNLLQWLQEGDRFWWVTPVLGYSATGQNYNTRTLITISHAPPSCRAECAVRMDHASAATHKLILLHTGQANLAPSATAAPLVDFDLTIGGGGEVFGDNASGFRALDLDGSRQIAVRGSSSTATDLYIAVRGWIDRRGKDE